MKIATIVGARPQFVKAAVLSREIASQPCIDELLIHTGQHFDTNMSDIFFDDLDIKRPDYNLGISRGRHGANTGRMLEAIEKVLINEKPDIVVVYGDTDSTLAAALAAAKMHIPLAHVEAGLRSFNRRMPEEINRVLTDHVSDLLLVPTSAAVENLRNEGISGENVHLVGDVMYDATLYYLDKSRKPAALGINEQNPFALCTIHRAENTDDDMRLSAIVRQLNRVSEKIPIVLPMHPRTASALKRLPGISFNRSIEIIAPLGFLEMTWMLSKCSVVITDSGGLQKEAFYHKKPCITLREETEWVELVKGGFNVLLSPFSDVFTDIVDRMMQTEIDVSSKLYGNGCAGKLVLDILATRMN